MYITPGIPVAAVNANTPIEGTRYTAEDRSCSGMFSAGCGKRSEIFEQKDDESATDAKQGEAQATAITLCTSVIISIESCVSRACFCSTSENSRVRPLLDERAHLD